MSGRSRGRSTSAIFVCLLSTSGLLACASESNDSEKSKAIGGTKATVGGSSAATSNNSNHGGDGQWAIAAGTTARDPSTDTASSGGARAAPTDGGNPGKVSGGAAGSVGISTSSAILTSGGSTTTTTSVPSGASAGIGAAKTTAGGTKATGGASSAAGTKATGGAKAFGGTSNSSTAGMSGAVTHTGGTTTSNFAGASAGGATAAPCSTFASPIITGTLFAEATGISGVVASRDQPGVLWIHSDRQKNLFGVDATGKLLGQWEISTGAKYFFIYNWEDISIQSVEGGPDKIWIGDIGNNFVRGGGDPRTSIKIMSIAEPTIDPTQATVGTATVIDNLEFTYPDGLHDAEAMAMDPLTGDLYVFAKEETAPSKIFRAKAPLVSGVFEELGTIDAYWLNGADFSPSGRELLVRNYTSVYYWTLLNGTTWADALTAPPNKTVRLKFTDGYYGEAIGFSAEESGFYVVSEQEDGTASSPVEFYAKNCK